ncbi:hypothetical protein E6C27_scaffold60G001800 [Cucumis melo var. makuwa]|uniref:NAC-alpha domain-containing protein 1 n=1 Tax=Cucumis melo var. makuwa TaxID=1194695 RepID=A0A5A7UC25_CUCMM|nr:hypothetical protein E6C27_scaffold60G001800 [Cucumis melo var. makuwa]
MRKATEGVDVNLYYLTDKAYGETCALRIRASFGSTRLIRASFGSTRLIRASFGSTRLIRASFGSTRLICASFGSTRLICAFHGTTRLLCRVGVQRGADRREAGRMREGHMDASDFLSLPLCILSEYFDCDFGLLNGRVLVFGSDLSLVRKKLGRYSSEPSSSDDVDPRLVVVLARRALLV